MGENLNKNYLLIGGVVALLVVVVGGVILLVSRQQAPATPPPPVRTDQPTLPQPPAPRIEETKPPEKQATEEGTMMAKEVVVEFSGTGFLPATVTVKKGTTVKFVNKSSTTMWVASAVHPTHQLLPGFDQLATGDSYSYTFTKIGSWAYHNHRPLVSGGTVVVTE